MPQPPQSVAAEATSTHPSPQVTCPAGQTQCPAVHVAPGAQASAQAPQFWASVATSLQPTLPPQ